MAVIETRTDAQHLRGGSSLWAERAHASLLRAGGVARAREPRRERPSPLPGGGPRADPFLTKLRATGMPIREVRRYAELMNAGEATNEERLALLEAHREAVLAGLEAPRATSSSSSGRSTSTRRSWDDHEAAQASGPGGVRHRPRVHGDVRLLRIHRRGRGRQDDSARPRAGHRLHRHGAGSTVRSRTRSWSAARSKATATST